MSAELNIKCNMQVTQIEARLRWLREHLNPWSTKKFNLNFQSLEVVSRYRDPQLQVTEILGDSLNVSPYLYQCFRIGSIFYV